jgi:hypothetical protein
MVFLFVLFFPARVDPRPSVSRETHRDTESQREVLDAAPAAAPAPQVVDQLAEDVRVEFEAFLFEYVAVVVLPLLSCPLDWPPGCSYW